MCGRQVQDVVPSIIPVSGDLFAVKIQKLKLERSLVALLSELAELGCLFSPCQLQALLFVANILLVFCVYRFGSFLLQRVRLCRIPGLQSSAGLVAAGHVVGKLPVPVLRARVTAVLQQHLGHSLVSLKASPMESSTAIVSCGIRIAPNGCLPIQQVFHHFKVALHSGLRECSVSTTVLRHRVCRLVEQRLNFLQLTIESEFEQFFVHLDLLFGLLFLGLLPAGPTPSVLLHLVF
mmetsp:Transcript_66968/g.157084  ORF Transcript_66968/g.157084 Transcript_66968/m.157084 type:complete len:235 (+) Transcript_66968:451-1155(+)